MPFADDYLNSQYPAAFKLKQACQYLGGLSESTVRRLVEDGRLKRLAAFRHIVIPKTELDNFIQSNMI